MSGTRWQLLHLGEPAGRKVTNLRLPFCPSLIPCVQSHLVRRSRRRLPGAGGEKSIPSTTESEGRKEAKEAASRITALDLEKVDQGLNTRRVFEKRPTEISALLSAAAAGLAPASAILSLLWFNRIL
jgi:hypothetical protein